MDELLRRNELANEQNQIHRIVPLAWVSTKYYKASMGFDKYSRIYDKKTVVWRQKSALNPSHIPVPIHMK